MGKGYSGSQRGRVEEERQKHRGVGRVRVRGKDKEGVGGWERWGWELMGTNCRSGYSLESC